MHRTRRRPHYRGSVDDSGALTATSEDGEVRATPGVEGLESTTSSVTIATLLLGLVTAIAAALKAATWPAVVGFDGWAYTMWGQSLARGEGIAFKGQTIPKPLAITLSFLFSWLPGDWGPIVIMSGAIGALVAGLLYAGTRLRGAIAGGLSVVALVVSTAAETLFEISDGVSAACVVWAVALRGPWRIAFFVLAGLLRPEAWPLAFIAGYTESAGSDRRRRVLATVAAGLAAPLLWVAFDQIFAGDALAGIHWLQDARVERAGGGAAPLVPKSASAAVETLRSVLASDVPSVVVLLAGLAGLVLLSRRDTDRSRFRRDLYPVIVFLVGLVTLIAFYIVVAELYERYMLPFTLTMLSLGAGCLVVTIVRRSVHIAPVALVVIISIAVGAWRLDVAASRKRTLAATAKTEASLPAVRDASGCGRIGVSGNWRARSFIPFLAGMSRMSARNFVVTNGPDGEPLEPGPEVGAIIKLHRGHGGRLPDWAKVETALGTMAIRPGCEAVSDASSDA